MNKDAILKTAVARWSNEDDAYVAYSPIDDGIVGVGDTPQEALATHKRFVEDEYQAYKEGKHAVYNKPGRPAKGKAKVTMEIAPSARDTLKSMAGDLGVSQGETVEYLIATYHAYKARMSAKVEKSDKPDIKLGVGVARKVKKVKPEKIHIISKAKTTPKSPK